MKMSPKRQRQHERLLAKMKPYQRALMEKRQAQAPVVDRETGKESARDEQPFA